MSDASGSPLEEVRAVLFGDERQQIAALRSEVQRLNESSRRNEALHAEVAELTDHVERLQALLIEERARAVTVGEVLVNAVATPQERPGELGSALRPEIELAVRESARVDSVVLAEALYPVMGPAMRKMIAALFTTDRSNPGETFVVDRVLLIEREAGLLLAAVHRDESDADDADVVSGMLDAIRMFVSDAFDAEEHDGLRDLRVGDVSVLVEWGPKAVLASVVRGVPTNEYRTSAALTLEHIHQMYAQQLDTFSGDVSVFGGALDTLGELRQEGEPEPERPPVLLRLAGSVLFFVVLALLVIWVL